MSQEEQNNLIQQTEQNESPGHTMPQHTEYASFYMGPLPPPETMMQYEQVIKGAANRIFVMAEDEAKHRRAAEMRLITIHTMGIVFAFLVTVIIMGLGAYVIIQGHGVAGTILCGTGVTGLIGTFVYGTKANSKNQAANK